MAALFVSRLSDATTATVHDRQAKRDECVSSVASQTAQVKTLP